MSFEQLVEEIKRLSHEEQVQLVDRMVEGFAEHHDPEMDREHLEIIAERQRSPGKLIPAEEVLKQVRDSLNER